MEILILLGLALGIATFVSLDTGTEPSEASGNDGETNENTREYGPLENADGDPLTGDGRHDLIAGTDEADSILGRKGNDTLQGRGGNDTIDGGSGNDQIDGEDDNDLIDGGSGNDTLIGGIGNDTIVGGVGFDFLEGRWGDDSLIGGIGADTLDGDQGQDTLDGGDDNDTLILNGTDTARGGEGKDEFRLQTGAGGEMMIIEDYSNADDRIVVEYDSAAPTPTVGVTDDGTDSFVTLNGVRVAGIKDAAGSLTIGDITLLASSR